MQAHVVTIIDHGAGNLRSVAGAFETLGAAVRITSDPEDVRAAGFLVLPGVGSFGGAMDRLRVTGLDSAIRDCATSGATVLGICLGMQLLGLGSEEDGGREGLGLVPGFSTRFEAKNADAIRVPHMGFNTVTWQPGGRLGRELPECGDFYFVHSYRMADPKDFSSSVIGTCDYGGRFVAGFEWQGSIFGVQFHPELSQGNGLVLLRNVLSGLPC